MPTLLNHSEPHSCQALWLAAPPQGPAELFVRTSASVRMLSSCEDTNASDMCLLLRCGGSSHLSRRRCRPYANQPLAGHPMLPQSITQWANLRGPLVTVSRRALPFETTKDLRARLPLACCTTGDKVETSANFLFSPSSNGRCSLGAAKLSKPKPKLKRMGWSNAKTVHQINKCLCGKLGCFFSPQL